MPKNGKLDSADAQRETLGTSGLPNGLPGSQNASKNAPPPSYAEHDANVHDATAAFSSLNLNASQTPTADQCIAHLKLLEAFHQLREDIALKDGVFGICDSFADTKVTAQEKAELLVKIREKRWAVYVARAAKRFEKWWTVYIELNAQMLKQAEIPKTFTQKLHIGSWLDFDCDNLPPLDVIMVWHAYQLNPRDFLEDCIRYGKLKFWRTGLPWIAVNSCINNDNFEFMATNQAIGLFESKTGYSWNNIDDQNLCINCPLCSKTHTVPWTKWNIQTAWMPKPGDGKLRGETEANGFADQKFMFKAPCSIVFDHDLLKAQKFRQDMEALLTNDVPMPGTILDIDGLPRAPRKDIQRHPPLFPNRLILGSDHKRNAIYESLEASVSPSRYKPSLELVRTVIEGAMADKEWMKNANHSFGGLQAKEEKIAIRKMMSRYWENSSPFALDLVGAVIRQGSFIEKMHAIDWIHSPALNSTMTRILTKYDRYITIIASHPKQVAVPTLDVDLAWHTHQLSPPSYYSHVVRQTHKFIDHDDKIEETKLSTAFEWTSKTYQKMFKDLYSECTCWYCEAIREAHTSTLSRAFGKSSTIDDQLSRLHSANSNPHNTPHISAHNAIKSTTDDAAKARLREMIHQQKLEREYKKSCDRARKNRREPPSKDEYMYAYAWGYPMYMPYYAPYMGDPCITPGMYAGNPACANFTAGAAGNCCAGSCGGGVAAGACSAGACGGGAAGGCGGSGGGGGCGGGGGGGGCGGGGGGGGCGGGG